MQHILWLIKYMFHHDFRLIHEDLDNVSMTYIEVEVPTGYVVNRDEIMRIYYSGVPGLSRVQFRDQTLFVFFDYVSEISWNV